MVCIFLQPAALICCQQQALGWGCFISAFTQKDLRILYRDSSFRPVHYQHNASSESSNSAMRDSASAPWSSAMRTSALRFNHLDTWICCDGAISSTVISLRFLLCSQSDMVSKEISISLYWTLFRFCCLYNHCQRLWLALISNHHWGYRLLR